MRQVEKRVRIGGMSCVNCQNRIEQRLECVVGIIDVSVSYRRGSAAITYDADLISQNEIEEVIEALGYKILSDKEEKQPDMERIICLLVIIVSLYVLLQRFGVLNLLVPSRLANTTMGYGMLFVVGVITSVHCIAMCGGIHLTQCLPKQNDRAENDDKWAAFRPAFLYNLGRVISYTAIGFVLGWVGMLLGGSVSTGYSTLLQGILKLIAGIFMVIMGINMLGIFPWLRKFQPRLPAFAVKRVASGKARSHQPLVVGLLNGLMPCGPLQSMQIVALASANPITGALSMFLFSLGTVPLMLGLGSIVSLLGKKFAQKVMCIGAVLVVVLGLAMLSQGGSLSGLLLPNRLLICVIALCILGIIASIPFRRQLYKVVGVITSIVIMAGGGLIYAHITTAGNRGAALSTANQAQTADGVQIVNSTLSSGSYPDIIVQVGIPVKWVIDAPAGSINGCNYKMILSEYGITHAFCEGENILEFTPTEAGTYSYTCWMGMIRGNIYVLEE